MDLLNGTVGVIICRQEKENHKPMSERMKKRLQYHIKKAKQQKEMKK